MKLRDILLRGISQWVVKLLFSIIKLENYSFKITATFPMGQWVKQAMASGKEWNDGWYCKIKLLLKKLCYIMICYIHEFCNGIIHVFNSSPPGAAYMHQWIRSALVQIMVVAYSAPSHYLNQWWVNWTLRKKLQWIKIQTFSFTKIHLQITYAKWQLFCPRGDESTPWMLN